MKIQHPRRNYSGVEIHQARRLEFVDGVAETEDSVALAAALAVKGYHQVVDAPVIESIPAPPAPITPKRRKGGKVADLSIDDDIPLDPADAEPTIDD